MLCISAPWLHCVVFCCEKPQVDSQIWRAGGDLWHLLEPAAGTRQLEGKSQIWDSVPINDLILRQVFTEEQQSSKAGGEKVVCIIVSLQLLDWTGPSDLSVGTGISVRFTKFIIFAVGRDYNRFPPELSDHWCHLSTSQLWNEWIQSRATPTTNIKTSTTCIFYWGNSGT